MLKQLRNALGEKPQGNGLNATTIRSVFVCHFQPRENGLCETTTRAIFFFLPLSRLGVQRSLVLSPLRVVS